MGTDSERLIRDARRGREAAFLRLFEEHHVPLYRFAWRLTGSKADAEDIVQECFLALLRPDCGFDPGRTSVRTYLFGAVRNQWLKRLRRSPITTMAPREQGEAPEPADSRTPETEAMGGEVAAAVARAVALLPDTQREVLLLAHYERLTLAEIGEITQLETTAVKSRLQRARATLRESLAEYAPRKERAL
jgi:RNA polymerase sigma-70 factor (ECF subfamily)